MYLLNPGFLIGSLWWLNDKSPIGISIKLSVSQTIMSPNQYTFFLNRLPTPSYRDSCHRKELQHRCYYNYLLCGKMAALRPDISFQLTRCYERLQSEWDGFYFWISPYGFFFRISPSRWMLCVGVFFYETEYILFVLISSARAPIGWESWNDVNFRVASCEIMKVILWQFPGFCLPYSVTLTANRVSNISISETFNTDVLENKIDVLDVLQILNLRENGTCIWRIFLCYFLCTG